MAAAKVRGNIFVRGLDVDAHAGRMLHDMRKNQTGQGREKGTDRK
jgi:hypothetical protein